MTFWGKSFQYDGIPSELYGVYILNFGEGDFESEAGAGVELFTKSIYRRPTPYLFGTSQSPVLSFPLTFGSKEAISGVMRDKVLSWLFGQNTYKKLQIMQADISSFYFNCILTEPKSVYVGNMNFAYKCTVICDSPWAKEFSKTLTQTYTGGGTIDEDFTFYNDSANADYLFPSVTFTLNGIGSQFTITNESDSDRQFYINGLSPNEKITVDNDRQILSSSSGLYRMSTFNKHWLRLIPGANNLNIAGAISEFTMTTSMARKIGG